MVAAPIIERSILKVLPVSLLFWKNVMKKCKLLVLFCHSREIFPSLKSPSFMEWTGIARWNGDPGAGIAPRRHFWVLRIPDKSRRRQDNFENILLTEGNSLPIKTLLPVRSLPDSNWRSYSYDGIICTSLGTKPLLSSLHSPKVTTSHTTYDKRTHTNSIVIPLP